MAYQPQHRINISTGQIEEVPFTAEELAARDAERATNAIVIPTPFFDYAQPFVNNSALWVKIWKALDDTRALFALSPTPTATTILANLRAQVNAVVAVIATAPQGVQDALIQERILEGSTTAEPLNPTAVSTMTAAECRIVIDVCQKAATKGMALALASFVLKNYIDS